MKFSDKDAPEAEFLGMEFENQGPDLYSQNSAEKARRAKRLQSKGVSRVTELQSNEVGRRVFEVRIPHYDDSEV